MNLVNVVISRYIWKTEPIGSAGKLDTESERKSVKVNAKSFWPELLEE